ncbi:DUF397 domain-containing protein [Streptomyces sp. NPDC000941]
MSQLAWRKSSYSGGGNGNCVEVAVSADRLILLRESDAPDVVAVTTRPRLAAFIAAIKAGDFDDFASLNP